MGLETLHGQQANPQADTVSLAIDPSAPATVYAGTTKGPAKSADGGATWLQLSIGFPFVSVSALAFDPASPNTVYAGLQTGGVFKSLDGGLLWTGAGTNLQDNGGPVLSLATDPTDANIVFAGNYAGPQRSANGGASWTLGTGAGADVTDIAVDPANHLTVFAASIFAMPVAKSTDSGLSWARMETGLPGGGGVALALDRLAPSTLYVAIINTGVFKSTNSAGSWSQVHSMNDVTALVVDPSNSSFVYAARAANGVWRSTDGGATWVAASTGLGSLNATSLAVAPTTPIRLYVGTTAGVFRSVDKALHWTAINTGLPSTDIRSLAVFNGTPATVAAGTFATGTFTYTDTSAAPIPDANGDGTVTAVDSLCILRVLGGFSATTDCPNPLPLGDVNFDGLITSVDALCVLRWLGGFPATPTCPLAQT